MNYFISVYLINYMRYYGTFYRTGLNVCSYWPTAAFCDYEKQTYAWVVVGSRSSIFNEVRS